MIYTVHGRPPNRKPCLYTAATIVTGHPTTIITPHGTLHSQTRSSDMRTTHSHLCSPTLSPCLTPSLETSMLTTIISTIITTLVHLVLQIHLSVQGECTPSLMASLIMAYSLPVVSSECQPSWVFLLLNLLLFRMVTAEVGPQKASWLLLLMVLLKLFTNGVTGMCVHSCLSLSNLDLISLQGTEHVTRTYPDGREIRTINGVEQPSSRGYIAQHPESLHRPHAGSVSQPHLSGPRTSGAAPPSYPPPPYQPHGNGYANPRESCKPHGCVKGR